MRAFVLCLLFAFTLAQNCKSTGCTKGNCCSYWGYCGNTNAHCGSGSMQCVCDCNGRNPCKSSGTTTPTPTTPTTSSEKTIWDFLYKKIGNKYGVAGLMGNLYAESGLISNNVQNSYEYRVGSDSSYTSKVDNGSYSRYSFAHDSAGYGLAQWTYWSRKQNLYDYAKKVKKSIGDATMQLEFLVSELQGSYSSVWNTLKSATSVLQASNSVLLKFERPADQSSSVQSKRASYGQSYYNKYAGSSSSNPNPPTPSGTKKGADLSKYQGNVNFSKLKSSVDFVILRAGYGRYSSQKDSKFEQYYKDAKANGIAVGAYHYSYAKSASEARTEANVLLGWLKGKQFEYPIYYDVEENSIFQTGRTNEIVQAFCDVLEQNKYWCGVYSFVSALNSHFSSNIRNRYALWVAQWANKCTYSGSYGMWQYTEKGKVNGISGNVDLDYCYVDYPSKIKSAGLNGFSKNPNPPTPPPTSCTKYASTDYLNIRKGPGTNYGKVKTINPGTIVCVVSTSNGWSKLSDGYYASATYLTKYTEPKPGSYKPRLTIPEYGNKYYNLVSDGGYSTGIAGKPKQAGLGVLSNCVGYASGRFNEIVGAGKFKYFNYPPNAVKFIEAAKNQGLTVSNTPSLGAIIVWGLRQNGVEQAGHVGVVEKINADGSIVTSESAWNGWAFKTKTRYNRSGNWDGGSYYFRGFIKNPAVK